MKKLRLVLFIVILFFSGTASTDYYENYLPRFTRMTETDHQILDLSGTWKFKLDPDDRGGEEKWFAPELDDSGWFDHPIPGSWNVQKSEWLDYVGAGWYRTWFVAPELIDDKLARLVFDGVSYQGDVYLNGELIGGHHGGFTCWSLNAGEKIKAGEKNHLVIRVDNRRRHHQLPPLVGENSPLGWWPYGGIHRAPRLEISPLVTLSSLKVTADHVGNLKGSFDIYLGVDHPVKAGIIITLTTLEGEPIKTIYETSSFSGCCAENLNSFNSHVPDIKPWSPETPGNRYRLVVKVESEYGSETQAVEIGFRTFEFRDGKAWLNGKPIFLRGINRHEDFPESGGVLTDERIEEDMKLLHEMNVNFMRPAHFPNDPRWLDACDREGIMVVHEIPLYQVGGSLESLRAAEGDELLANATQQLAEMIQRDRNHPSVVMWSVGNENVPFFPSVRNLLKRLYDTAKSLDPSRPVTFAMLTSPYRLTPWLDLTGDIPDVLMINEYYGWYFGEAEGVGDFLDALHKKWPDKAVIVSEFGAEGVEGVSGELYPVGFGRKMDFSLSYQEEFYRIQFKEILARPFVVGTMPWVFADFRDDKRPESAVPMFNTKGLLTYDRRKKPAFDVVSGVYKSIAEKEAR